VSKIMNCYDKWLSVADRRVEMGEVHEVEIFFVERF